MPIKKIKRKNNKYNVSVEEAYKTLKDPKMSKLECNFKVKNKSGGTKPPKYFLDFQKQVLELFNQLISRIDNLVSKNNLKE